MAVGTGYHLISYLSSPHTNKNILGVFALKSAMFLLVWGQAHLQAPLSHLAK